MSNSSKDIAKLVKESNNYESLILTDRQLCDIELILNRGFAPLTGFLNKGDYESVLKDMRLEDGTLWPIPITLDASNSFIKKIINQNKITLKDKEGFPLAILDITDIWKPDYMLESKLIYGSLDIKHPGINYLMKKSCENYIGGHLVKIALPRHYDYKKYRHTPSELKSNFRSKNWRKIIAFQTRNPLHKAHVEMTKRAMKELNAKLLLHPAVGNTKPGDLDHFTRVRCYEHVLNKYNQNEAILSLLPIAMRMGGPREALWHALIRKNFGCTHLIVGRDHAGPGLDSKGSPFYGPYDAQKLLFEHAKEIKIKTVPFKLLVYIPKSNSYSEIETVKKNTDYKIISGTKLRSMLDTGKKVPEWFTYPEVIRELKISRPPLSKRGFTVFFTGLSGSGKSTLANGLMVKLLEHGDRPVTLLDGDIVRTHLSSELGFSKKHRSLNVQRIGFVAGQITKNGGVALCAPIAPYEKDRAINRDLISSCGGYVEIFVNTPLTKCEERDVKGLYSMARKGIIKEFTGISDPYEKPKNPDMVINSSGVSPQNLVDIIFNKIKKLGFIS